MVVVMFLNMLINICEKSPPHFQTVFWEKDQDFVIEQIKETKSKGELQ